MRHFLFLIFLCFIPLYADARLSFHGGFPASGGGGGGGGVTCPYGSAFADGCAGAVAANWQQPTFFTAYATTTNGEGQSYVSGTATGTISGTTLTVSGATANANFTNAIQVGNTVTGAGISTGCAISSGGPTTWTLNKSTCGNVGPETVSFLVRPPWNVAGVDYPVGIPSSVSLKDPATLPLCSSPAAPACKSTNAGAHVIFIYGANPDFNGYDMSLEGGWVLEVNDSGHNFSGGPGSGNVSGAVTIENCKFIDGSNFQFPSTDQAYGTAVIQDDGGTTNTITSETLLHNYMPLSAITTDGTSTSVGSSTSSISGTTMSAGTVTGGAIAVGRSIEDGNVNVRSQTYVASGSSPTWTLNQSQTVGSQNMWDINQTINQPSSLGQSIPGVNVVYKYNAFLDFNGRVENWEGGEFDFNYFEGNNYNTPAHGEMTKFINGQINTSNPLSTSSWTTSSTTIPLNATCAAIAPTVGQGVMDESTTSGSSYIGTVSSCTGSTLTLQANALIAGANGDRVGFLACQGQCPQVNVNFTYNTVLEPSSFAGGWTAIIYLSSGQFGGNWNNVNFTNNSFVINASKLNVTSNSNPGGACNPTQCQITWNAGQVWTAFSGLPIHDGGGIAGVHGASIKAQISGTVGGSGVWNYLGTSNATNGQSIYMSLQGDGIISNGGGTGDWSSATLTCQNNYVDGAAGSASSITGQFCHQQIAVGTTSFSGNVNMNLNAVQTP